MYFLLCLELPMAALSRSNCGSRSLSINSPDDLLNPEKQVLLSHPGSLESQKPVWQERIRTSICCLLGSPELPMRPPYQAFFCPSCMMQTITFLSKRPQASALPRSYCGSLKHLRSLFLWQQIYPNCLTVVG